MKQFCMNLNISCGANKMGPTENLECKSEWQGKAEKLKFWESGKIHECLKQKTYHRDLKIGGRVYG